MSRKGGNEMLLKAAVAALVLAVVTPAFAQAPTPIDLAVMTCVAPGFSPDGDRFAALTSLPKERCERACEATAVGCRAVAKSVDRCGASFLRALAKVSMQACRGRGFPARLCREIKAEADADIDWWKAQGLIERDACNSEVEALCLSRCQSGQDLYGSLVPAGTIRIGNCEVPQGQTGDAFVYLNYEDLLPPARFSEELESGFSEAGRGQTGQTGQIGEGVRCIALPEGETTYIRKGVIVPRQTSGGVIISSGSGGSSFSILRDVSDPPQREAGAVLTVRSIEGGASITASQRPVHEPLFVREQAVDSIEFLAE
jgi:hypothetical protein